MKKVMFLATMFAVSTMFASCDKEKVISLSQLPTSSQTFLKTHFPDVTVGHIIKETEGLKITYTVYFINGIDIDFEKNGDWDDVDGHNSELPQSILNLLPAGIREYVSTNFPNYKIVEINKERYGYEIGLSGEIDLKFNHSGSFIKYDD